MMHPVSTKKNLNSFNNYCKNWKLNINKDKSKVIIFGARKFKTFNFKLGDTKLEIVDSYKYLGTFFRTIRKFCYNAYTYSCSSK